MVGTVCKNGDLDVVEIPNSSNLSLGIEGVACLPTVGRSDVLCLYPGVIACTKYSSSAPTPFLVGVTPAA